ncbi:MAG: lactate racemase domain-containing protein [Pirellulaceae bacterium]|nr:lactate racemase domain-containing protein [Pirellulaceae bacterium]
MSLYFAAGSPTTVLTDEDLQQALAGCFQQLGLRERVLIIPPDFTRFHSQAGKITCMIHEQLGNHVVDVMPALGTHDAMESWQLERMYPSIPPGLIRVHDWRKDVVTIGQVPAEFVADVTDGLWTRPWPAQLNRLLWEGQHDLIMSIGQVVPHEVIGMANYNKNIFVGTGGSTGINESHFIGAAYGMERMMGRADTPLRRILNQAESLFCQHLPLLYVLTVVGEDERGQLVIRGLFIGDDPECFERASELSLQVNFTLMDQQPDTVVAYLDPEEFHSTWLGNKAVYRTRLLIADEGELIVLAPGVKTFGEDKQIDLLIRKYGYRKTEEVMKFVDEQDDLRQNLSAAAHLIHGSSEGRFRITYCPGHLTEAEVRGVGYQYGDLTEMIETYNPERLSDGWNDVEGKRIFFVRNPALGLWASKARLTNG